MGDVIEDVSESIESIHQHPGFFDTLGRSESLLLLKKFAATPGLQETDLAQELLAFIPHEGALLSAGWRELARRLLDWFSGVKIDVVDETQLWLPFQVHALWCPPVDGVEASLKVSFEENQANNCRIEVAGVGGGPEFSLSLKVADSFTTTTTSIAVAYDFLTVWRLCRMEAKGHIAFFPRMQKILRKSHRVRTLTLLPTAPAAEWGALRDDVQIDLTSSPAKMTRALEIVAGTKWEASALIEAFGVKVGPKYATTMKWTTISEYKLPPGHRYRAQQFEHVPWWWWRVD